jgi:hypothetical protein
MMALFFGKLTHTVDELLRCAEVGEFVRLLQVVFVHNFPAVEFR